MIDMRRMGPIDQARHARRRNAPHPDFIAKLDQQWQEHVISMREYDRLGFRGMPERFGSIKSHDLSDATVGFDGYRVGILVMGCASADMELLAKLIAVRFANRISHLVAKSSIARGLSECISTVHTVGPWDKRWWEVAS